MAKATLSELDDYELVNESQDVRGWPLVDEAGNKLGTVTEFIADTDSEYVTSLVIDDGNQVAARDVNIGDNVVILRGASRQAGVKGARGAVSKRTAVAGTDNKVRRGVASSDVSATDSRPRHGEGEIAVPVVEEQIRIGKRTVESGGVRVRSRVEEVPVEESVRLREEHVHVERRPANRPVTDADARAIKGGDIEVTERSEEAVVAKRSRVVEEVVVNKEVVEHDKTVRDSVRRTEVEVEKLEDRGEKSKGRKVK